MQTSYLAFGLLVAGSILSLILFGLDKFFAKQKLWRIPEKTFFLLALLGGGLGIWLGMRLFRHKTRHASFRIGIPILTLVNLIGLALLVWQLPVI